MRNVGIKEFESYFQFREWFLFGSLKNVICDQIPRITFMLLLSRFPVPRSSLPSRRVVLLSKQLQQRGEHIKITYSEFKISILLEFFCLLRPVCPLARRDRSDRKSRGGARAQAYNSRLCLSKNKKKKNV